MTHVKEFRIVLLIAIVAVALGANFCNAGTITITETFSTDADPFPGTSYSDWSFTANNGTMTPTVANGVLGIAQAAASGSAEGVAAQTSSDLFGTATFGTDFTVAADLGASVNDSAGSVLAGISIGNIAGLYLPGHSAGFKWRNLATSDETAYIGMGFTPTESTSTPLQSMVVDVEPDGDDYKLSVTITEGSNSFSTNKTFTTDQLGTLNNVGLVYRGWIGSTNGATSGLYDNFAVTIVPEPSSVVLLICGVTMLLGVMRLRRKRA